MIQARQFHRYENAPIDGLAEHMERNGQQIAILVDDVYQVVDGERRLEAARQLGWDTILCLATGNFEAMSTHMSTTMRRQRAPGGLPHLGLHPRDINELADLLSRFYEAQVKDAKDAQTRSKRRGLYYRRDGFNAALAETLQEDPYEVRAIRSLYLLEETARTRWPELSAQVSAAVAEWDAAWPKGPRPYSIRTRLYERIKASDGITLAPYLSRAMGSRAHKKLHAVHNDSHVLARNQKAGIEKGLTSLEGIGAGFTAMGAISRRHDLADLERWIIRAEGIRQQLTAWRRQVIVAKAEIQESARAEESNTDE